MHWQLTVKPYEPSQGTLGLQCVFMACVHLMHVRFQSTVVQGLSLIHLACNEDTKKLWSNTCAPKTSSSKYGNTSHAVQTCHADAPLEIGGLSLG